jgi:hypothetical protein
MCRQAAHRTCMDAQLPRGSLICEPCPLIPHALGERIAVRGFERERIAERVVGRRTLAV